MIPNLFATSLTGRPFSVTCLIASSLNSAVNFGYAHGLPFAQTPEFIRCLGIWGESSMPEQMHTDNGPPFGSPISLRRMTSLAVWFMDLGVTPCTRIPGNRSRTGGMSGCTRI